MNETASKNQQQIFANLTALRQEMEKMAGKTKQTGDRKRDERQEVQRPMLVIRGK
jgi:hypothetical protein